MHPPSTCYLVAGHIKALRAQAAAAQEAATARSAGRPSRDSAR